MGSFWSIIFYLIVGMGFCVFGLPLMGMNLATNGEPNRLTRSKWVNRLLATPFVLIFFWPVYILLGIRNLMR